MEQSNNLEQQVQASEPTAVPQGTFGEQHLSQRTVRDAGRGHSSYFSVRRQQRQTATCLLPKQLKKLSGKDQGGDFQFSCDLEEAKMQPGAAWGKLRCNHSIATSS